MTLGRVALGRVALGRMAWGLVAFAMSSSCSVVLDDLSLRPCDSFVDESGDGIPGKLICARALNGSLPPGQVADVDCDPADPDCSICVPWECVAGRCVPNTTEVCDGFDNDCNGAIDDGVDPTTAFSAGSDVPLGIDLSVAKLQDLRVTADGPIAQALYVDTARRARIIDVVDGERAGELYIARNQGLDSMSEIDTLTDAGALDQCWTRSFPGEGRPIGDDGRVPAPEAAPTRCDFARLATSLRGEGGIVAAVNRTGCAEGQLRVGSASADMPSAVLMPGPEARSNSFFGVGVVPGQSCTAADVDACNAALIARVVPSCSAGCAAANERCVGDTCVPVECTTNAECAAAPGGVCACGRCVHETELAVATQCGVASVNVAATSGRPNAGLFTVSSQGLVATTHGAARLGADASEADNLGADPYAGSCAEIERPVSLSGAYVLTRGGQTWTTTTNEGTPQVIGQTRSASPPAIVSPEGVQNSFAVAYAASQGDIAVHVVEPLPEPVLLDSIMSESIAGETQTCDPDAQFPLPASRFTQCGTDVGECISGAPRCDLGQFYCDGEIRPSAEICGNTLDEDCDGLVDETTAAAPCVESCSGSAETCNAVDDDCDGMIDEETGGVPCGGNRNEMGNAICRSGAVPAAEEGACQQGATVCRGGVLLCEGAVNPRVDASGNCFETPDGVDEDCDGMIDEDAEACVPAARERCNGRDDDCDGTIDETPQFSDEINIQAPQTERPIEVIRQCGPTNALEIGAPESVAGLGLGAIEDLALAEGFASTEEVTFGLTWRELSGGQATIGFQALTFSLECTSCRPGAAGEPPPSCGDEACVPNSRIGSLLRTSDPVALTVRPGNYSVPSISYIDEGFLLRGEVMRGGVPSRIEQEGGWYVAWAESTRDASSVWVRRVAAHDARPVSTCEGDAQCGLRVYSGTQTEVAFPGVFLFTNSSGAREARYVYALGPETSGMDTLVNGRLVCAADM